MLAVPNSTHSDRETGPQALGAPDEPTGGLDRLRLRWLQLRWRRVWPAVLPVSCTGHLTTF